MEKQKQLQEFYDSNPRLDEKGTVLFEDDILAAEEYDRIFAKRLLSSEAELMAAVLDEAVSDYRRYLMAGDKRSIKHFTEVEAWVLKDDYEWIFSFVNCCEALGVEPSHVRDGLLRWKQHILPTLLIAPLVTPQRKIPQKLFHQAA